MYFTTHTGRNGATLAATVADAHGGGRTCTVVRDAIAFPSHVCAQQAMELAGLSSTDELDVVELIGGGSRIPAVAALVQEALGGRELSRTLNSKEAAAEGCAWQAALQSGRFKYVLCVGGKIIVTTCKLLLSCPVFPVIRVNIPELKECAHRTIMGTWQGAKGEVVAAPLVAAGSPLPADAALVIAPTYVLL